MVTRGLYHCDVLGSPIVSTSNPTSGHLATTSIREFSSDVASTHGKEEPSVTDSAISVLNHAASPRSPHIDIQSPAEALRRKPLQYAVEVGIVCRHECPCPLDEDVKLPHKRRRVVRKAKTIQPVYKVLVPSESASSAPQSN